MISIGGFLLFELILRRILKIEVTLKLSTIHSNNILTQQYP